MRGTIRLLLACGITIGIISLCTWARPHVRPHIARMECTNDRISAMVSKMVSDPPIPALLPVGGSGTTLGSAAQEKLYCEDCDGSEPCTFYEALDDSHLRDLPIGGELDPLGVTVRVKVPANETVTVFNRKPVKNDASRTFTFADRCVVMEGGRILGANIPTRNVVAFTYVPPLTTPTRGDACPSGVVSIMTKSCLARWEKGETCIGATRSSDEELTMSLVPPWSPNHDVASLFLWQQTEGANRALRAQDALPIPDDLTENTVDLPETP